MFFGAGNIVFPLIVGQAAGNMVGWAMVGLMVGAVGIPLLGLIAMTYYDGDYRKFFASIGPVPAFLVVLFIMILIGPINAIPRCISLSYGTIKMYMPQLSSLVFSIGACLVIFAATVRKSRVVDLLGDLLSPLLVVSLTVIIIKGLLVHPAAPLSSATTGEMLKFGLLQGYNTMDLLGTFFFSGVIVSGLRGLYPHEKRAKVFAWYSLQASMIAAGLLGFVYIGFAYVASYYSSSLMGASPEVLLGTVAHMVLGKSGGFFVSMAVALACLTTAITLAVVVTEFLQSQVFNNRISYFNCLVGTLATACVFANFEFGQIVAMMVPVLVVIYPALIVLTILNIFQKTHGLKQVKLPVYFATAIFTVWQHGGAVADFASRLIG